jgi:AcrR family transcriptional regulator
VAKADDRRSELIELLADHVLAHGLSASSLRPLAKAARLSDRMLLYYFKDKDELMQGVLACIVAHLTVRLNELVSPKPEPLDDLASRLLPHLLSKDFWPYMCVWLEIATLSARGDAFYRAVGSQIGEGFLAWGANQLESPTPTQAKTDAMALLVRIEGSVLLHSLGILKTI